MEDLSLRSALGVESCKWDTAGQFAIPLRQIDLLPYTDDVDRDYQWIAQQFYHILFRPLGKSLVDNKRRCAWYFGRDLPAHNHQVPDHFDMIRLVPQRHYICFYDTSSTDLKPKYIAKLDMLKPHHLFDLRYAQPKVRQRLLKLNRKIRAGKESLLKQTLKKSLPATGIDGEADGDTPKYHDWHVSAGYWY